MIYKSRCALINHISKEEADNDTNFLKTKFPQYNFVRDNDWYSDDPPNYPIKAFNLDGYEIVDDELKKLQEEIDDELLIRNVSRKFNKKKNQF